MGAGQRQVLRQENTMELWGYIRFPFLHSIFFTVTMKIHSTGVNLLRDECSVFAFKSLFLEAKTN